MIQDRPFLWKSHWKKFGWAQKLDRMGSQGITRDEQIVLTRLMKTQICHLAASSEWGVSQ